MRALALTALALGCVGLDPLDAPPLDRARFAADVQPLLAARCATPVCHGSERRRLRVYAPGYFRRDPLRVHRDEPLDDAELDANLASAAAFAADIPRAEDSLLVTKPLARVAHLGGRVFASPEECEAIVAWMRAGGVP